MDNDRKLGIRIIAERINVTTIRRPAIIYCERCRRALGADEISLAVLGSRSQDVAGSEVNVNGTDQKEEKSK